MSDGHAAEIEMSSTPKRTNEANQDSLYHIQATEDDSSVDRGQREADVEAGEEDTMVVNTRRRSIAHSYGLVGGDDGAGGGLTSLAERRLARREFWRRMMINGSLITLWYMFSIGITVYNKWMFSSNDAKKPQIPPTAPGDDTDVPMPPIPPKKPVVFPFPLFTTCVHMAVQFCLASLVLYFIPKFRPTHENAEYHQSHSHDPHNRSRSNSRARVDTQKGPIMTWWFYLTRIGPCGAATSLDIGLGNMSFKYITLTFYTMCKSSVLGFVLIFAFLFGLEKPSWKLGGIIAIMTVGVFLMVAGEAQFNTTGFVLIMSSAASSGFRWSLTQILLIRHPATSNPFSSIFFLAPIMFLTLFGLAIPVEELPKVFAAFEELAADKGMFASLMILLFPGCLAFLMTASEFALLQRTSVVTLSICGIFKEVLTISTAYIVFKDTLSTVNGVGLAITIFTIGLYNYWKIQKMKDEAREGAHAKMASGFDIDGDLSGSSSSILGARQDGEYAPVAGDDADEDTERVVRHTRGSSRNIASEQIPPGLMKSSLSVGVGSASVSGIGRVDSPKPSPVKRPEDLE